MRTRKEIDAEMAEKGHWQKVSVEVLLDIRDLLKKK